ATSEFPVASARFATLLSTVDASAGPMPTGVHPATKGRAASQLLEPARRAVVVRRIVHAAIAAQLPPIASTPALPKSADPVDSNSICLIRNQRCVPPTDAETAHNPAEQNLLVAPAPLKKNHAPHPPMWFPQGKCFLRRAVRVPQ